MGISHNIMKEAARVKLFKLSELTPSDGEHIFSGVIPGKYINKGALSFAAPGQRSHSNDGPGGSDRHVHGDEEVFLILEGEGAMELNGAFYPLCAGDIFIAEPGEDHHLTSSQRNPLVTLWFHAGAEKNEKQLGK